MLSSIQEVKNPGKQRARKGGSVSVREAAGLFEIRVFLCYAEEFGEARLTWSKKEHQIKFRALDNVAHDITGNAWKLRAIVFFFLHG
jgi:hypothetical protein